MKAFLDNCLPRTLKPYLGAGHDVEHARDRQWGDLSNGELLSRVEAEFDIFITVDRSQRKQQEERKKGYEKYQLAFIVLRVFSNRLEQILPFADEINASLDIIQSGEVHYIGESQLLKGL
ncbi:MAG: hypothetical protein AB7U82_21980 [Blastocatellales bacterium]